jgi:hypothetical protein
MAQSTANLANGINGCNGAREQRPYGVHVGVMPDHRAAEQPRVVETEFVIVGAGPAGAALACFLTSYGMFSSSSKCDYEAQGI